MPPQPLTIDRQSWLLLIVLSVLWGCSFFFVGLALRELPEAELAPYFRTWLEHERDLARGPGVSPTVHG